MYAVILLTNEGVTAKESRFIEKANVETSFNTN